MKAFAAFALACAIASARPAPARADAAGAQDLVVGSVRDADGRPVAGAWVHATDSAGMPAGQDRTDELGTFAIHLTRAAAGLEIRCRHCRPERVAASAGANLAIVVLRYAALESDVPDANDLTALPYGRSAQVLGLVPFVLPSANGSTVSDRGLGGGSGLVTDDGAALVDAATGSSALIDFPDRSVRHVAVTRADDAFRYGPYAAGGVFALDTLADAAGAAVDAGATSALAVAPAFGALHPALGVSADAGVVARRGDLDLTTPLGGGGLRAGVTAGSQLVDTYPLTLGRALDGARFAYATASRRYRTSMELATSRAVAAQSGASSIDYASAYDDAAFRIEHPGTILLAAGLRAAQQSASYDRYVPLPSALAGRTNAYTLYVEGHGGDARTRIDAGLGSAVVSTHASFEGVPSGATGRALLPAFALTERIAGGLYARAGYSEGLRLPTLLESAAQPLQAAPALERSELLDGALGFDSGGRVRAEAVAYREFARGAGNRRLDGIGASLVWQVTPLLSLRAWSLRTSPLSALAQPYVAVLPASRQVLWATFERRDLVRIDAILQRDVGSYGRAAIALDGDLLVPAAPHVALAVTTSRRNGVRRYGVGLRAR